MEYGLVTHDALEPVFSLQSRILILGTMPSPKSRELGFYYSHPQNRFWRILGDLLEQKTPQGKPEQEAFLLRHNIALWDVLRSCEIMGAEDSSIRAPRANDLSRILDAAPIEAVFTTGTKAAALYRRLCFPSTKREAVALPSPSPANCRHYSYEQLRDAYKCILPYLA